MSSIRSRCRIALLLASCLFRVCTTLHAQVAGRINGYVKDPSDASIAHATVKAVSVEQQLTRTTETDQTGYYDLLAMPPGVYRITFGCPGFESQAQTGVTLTTGQSLRLDVVLKLGTVQSQVTVSSTATLVNTTDQTLSALIDDRRIQDLPLNGRNVIGLAGIVPGVTNVYAPQELNNTRGGPTMSVNGGRAEDNNFTLNGANFTHFGQSTSMNYPAPDAIQEVRIQTQNFTSEYGNSAGSQVSVTSKSGTNTFHGAAWEFLRNTDLNARSFFQGRRAATHQNQAGGAAGAPVKKDKLFFFGYYQRLWNRPETTPQTAFLPTSSQRNGDFGGLKTSNGQPVTLVNPRDPVTNKAMVDPAGKPCVQNNIILSGCLSPAAQKVLNQFVPQTSGTYLSLFPTPSNNFSTMGRIDYIQSSKHKLYGHFYVDQYNQVFAGGNLPYETGSRSIGNKDFSLTSTYAFSPTLLNQLTVDFMHAVSHDTPVKEYLPSSLGIGLPPMDGEGVTLNVNGYFNLATANPGLQDYRNWHLREDMSLIHGRHTLKWGYEAHRVTFTLATRFQTRTATFNNGVATGDALANFTLGVFDSLSQDFGNSTANYVGWKHFFYFQDEFKVSPRLTLTLGARYEPYYPWSQKNQHYTYTDIGHFDVTSTVHPDALPGVRFVGDPGTPNNGKLGYNDMNNIGPRVGFAWDISGNGRTSVRGGYGLFYDQVSANVGHQAEAPFAGTDVLNRGRLDDPYGSLKRPLPPQGTDLPGNFGCVKISTFPGVRCAFPLPANLVSTDPHLVTPYTQSMSLTIEHQMARDLAVEVSYAGKMSQKLEGHRLWNAAVFKSDPVTGAAPSAQNVNDRVAYPQTIGLFNTQCRLLGNDYRANYHSAQLRVNKRFSHGLSFLASYVFSKELDNVVNLNVNQGQPQGTLGLTPGEHNPFNLKLDKGRGSFDHTHVFNLSWLWTQSHKFSHPLASRFLEGWSIGAFHTIQTGAPFAITMGTDKALNGTNQGNLQHAQLAAGMTYADVAISHPNRNAYVSRYFNTAAFVPIRQVPDGTYGNAGRNFLDGPGLSNTDFTLMRDFAVHERLKAQLRGEFFNAFNQAHFNPPDSTVASGSFGQIKSAGPGRVIQLALKLIW